jgi:hypothetical protein
VSHAAYGYKDSPMYAQIENCVQLAIIVWNNSIDI